MWLDAYEDALNRIQSHAAGFSEAQENDEFDIELKQSLFKTRRGRVYRIIFTIEQDVVSILRVRAGARGTLRANDL